MLTDKSSYLHCTAICKILRQNSHYSLVKLLQTPSKENQRMNYWHTGFDKVYYRTLYVKRKFESFVLIIDALQCKFVARR